MKKTVLLLVTIFMISCSKKGEKMVYEPAPVNMEITHPAALGENREFAFTDKKSGYFYGHTHGPGREWYSGWNINTQRIFSDYALFTDDVALDRSTADISLMPHRLRREYPTATEDFYLFDDTEAIRISMETEWAEIGIRLFGQGMISLPDMRYNYAVYTVSGAPGKMLLLAPIRNTELTLKDHEEIRAAAAAGGFYLVLADSEEQALEMVEKLRENGESMLADRRKRLENLHLTNRFETGVPVVDRALAWNRVSLDALIMKQTGWGIYAGLPWFNDYWGRDMFISLPGAALVNGQLDVAANILRSFAGYQNRDEDHTDYGRIPNRLRPDEVIYNTTDGTPRFVAQICAYLDYGGDESLASDLFDAVVRATEGPIRHHVDEHGYLTHGDAETWMDAREEPTKRAYSPRGNRANDIQALWYNQLRCAARLARMNDEPGYAEKWDALAGKMKERFVVDFFDDRHTYMADRITARGVPSFSVRPNQLFALDLIDDPNKRWFVTREAWERLVYPWGTASLDQDDLNFHPWHEAPDYYHKDAAYHNGTVWIWNNGIAMQRMIEVYQPDIAWNLFLNMSMQTMDEGAPGMLAENTDALPRPGEEWPRLSGTFSQAWSSAEYLRVWYQYFIGVRPHPVSGRVLFNPNIPTSLDKVAAVVPVPGGTLVFNYNRRGDGHEYLWKYEGNGDLEIVLEIPGFQTTRVELSNGYTLRIEAGNREMHLQFYDGSGRLAGKGEVWIDPGKRQLREASKAYFGNTTFAEPNLRDDLRSLGGSRRD